MADFLLDRETDVVSHSAHLYTSYMGWLAVHRAPETVWRSTCPGRHVINLHRIPKLIYCVITLSQGVGYCCAVAVEYPSLITSRLDAYRLLYVVLS
jgi:hypothetical protein